MEENVDQKGVLEENRNSSRMGTGGREEGGAAGGWRESYLG